MVKPKYLMLVYCGIDILFKNILVCGKNLFYLRGIIRKLDIEALTVSLLKSNQIDKLRSSLFIILVKEVRSEA